MARYDISRLRGEMAENRFRSLIERLVVRFDWVLGVKKACRKLDQVGVDFIVTICTRTGRPIHLPIQIKSSKTAADKFRKQYTEYVRQNMLILVVNEYTPDNDLIFLSLANFYYHRRRETDFTSVFSPPNQNRRDRQEKVADKEYKTQLKELRLST